MCELTLLILAHDCKLQVSCGDAAAHTAGICRTGICGVDIRQLILNQTALQRVQDT
jgi:hypothetical protein